jgi:hypothetical protein
VNALGRGTEAGICLEVVMNSSDPRDTHNADMSGGSEQSSENL